MINLIKSYYLFFITGLLLLFTACSNSYSGRANIGTNESPVPGEPFFTFTTSSNITETGETQALLFLSVYESSLIFKNNNNNKDLSAQISLDIDISSGGKNKISETHQMNFSKEPDMNYHVQNEAHRSLVYDIAPGNYEVKVTIRDLNTNKEKTIKEKLLIPTPDNDEVFVSNIRFYEKKEDSDQFISVNDYSINNAFDSLKFEFQVTNGLESENLEIESNLIRFEADMEPARSMSYRNPRRSSLIYKGIDYTDWDPIQTNRRTLEGAGSVSIEYSFTNLPMGNYRFEVAVISSSGREYAVRDFSIKSKSFPYVKTPRELARPLIYLMKESEHEKLMSIQSNDSLKAAIDAFWLKNIANAPKARTILKLYYERVEEANKRFSNYKEGWKTDPGMIYILFGPALYTDEGLGEMTWFYGFDSGNRMPSIYFKDTQYGNIKYPFKNYVLRRSDEFFSLQYQQIQAWNDGVILFLSQ